jgi:hypothetical protein
MTEWCELLNDCLARALSEDLRAGFVAHLKDCAACRQEVHEHERLSLLLQEAVTRLQPAPGRLGKRVEEHLAVQRRRRVVPWACGLAAALAVGAFGLWWLTRPPAQELGVSPSIATDDRPPKDERAPHRSVSVAFKAEKEVIAVPLRTDRPNITIIWVYPAVEPGPKSVAKPTKSAQAPERNGT